MNIDYQAEARMRGLEYPQTLEEQEYLEAYIRQVSGQRYEDIDASARMAYWISLLIQHGKLTGEVKR